jgi:hypothetical protein
MRLHTAVQPVLSAGRVWAVHSFWRRQQGGANLAPQRGLHALWGVGLLVWAWRGESVAPGSVLCICDAGHRRGIVQEGCASNSCRSAVPCGLCLSHGRRSLTVRSSTSCLYHGCHPGCALVACQHGPLDIGGVHVKCLKMVFTQAPMPVPCTSGISAMAGACC